MQIKFDVFWKKSLGTLYKDISIDVLGKEAIVDLDLREVSNIYVNFKVNDKSFTDLVEIVDIEKSLIRIPFKTDVIKLGTNELELVATMKNGDVKPSQTFAYTVDKSLENPNSVEADTNYPVLIELMDLAGNKLIDMDKSIQKVNTSIENMTNEISNYKEATTNALNGDISSYKETTTKELENKFNNYSSNTTSNITRVLDNKIVEVDNVVSIKSNELDVKFTTKSNEITKTLNDEITKVDKTLNSEINKVNTTLTNKVNEVDRVLENKVNEVDEALDTTITTINGELDKKSLEVDNKVNAKIVEIDNRVNAKINEVDSTLNNKINEVNEVVEEVELSEQARKEEHTELVEELSSYSSDMNNVKDRVDVLEAKITDNEVIVDLKNKVNNHEERITTSEKTIRHQGILLNALNDLDDTISIEEEGTIISLPQSDDGKIIIDELQGNTLVNYCTNGSEELTLNNEINVQGTDVALTDTIDNGKVDVVCEGNTLVNLISLNNFRSSGITQENAHSYKMTGTSEAPNFIAKFKKKPSNDTALTYFADFTIPTGATQAVLKLRDVNNNYTYVLETINITNQSSLTLRGTFVTRHSDFSDESGLQLVFSYPDKETSNGKSFEVSNFMLLEGDYTNKPIPSYFEGMKSAFELEDNRVKIISQNKNLFDVNKLQIKNGSLYGYMYLGESNECTISITDKDTSVDISEVYFGFTAKGKDPGDGYRWVVESGRIEITQLTSYDNLKYFSFFPNDQETLNKITSRFNVQIEEGNVATSYVPYATNTHSIQLSEPLRGLPNGVCDKFVKQGGKWYVERNCGGKTYNGSDNEKWKLYSTLNGTEVITKGFTVDVDDIIVEGNQSTRNRHIWNNFNTVIQENMWSKDVESVSMTASPCFRLRINRSKAETVEQLKEWLKNNPTSVVYQLVTPTYEEITDPQVITYLDTTHISTNSIIPCTMKVTNTGYNTIIRPSTLYTIAFDTNTSGEVNIDLGGAKTSTTNNIATITTPSTLTDDTLRLYGKGIKASKVRLLEGDKTNYIPSFFEGMKSCFEDKEQEDGSYEVEIVSYNENKSNSIQLQLNEPLRAVGDVKDRFVLKDGKLMIEKCTEEIIFNGGENWRVLNYPPNQNGTHYQFDLGGFDYNPDMWINTEKYMRCDKLNIGNGELHWSSIGESGIGGDGKKIMITTSVKNASFNDLLSFKQWLSENPIRLVLVKKEPTYEEVPYETQKLILECFENGTLFIDTLIPPTVSVTYSANKPVVSKLNKVNEVTEINTEDIAITQMAVDFLLMSSLGEEMINFKIRGGTNMSAYFASRIIKGALKYEDVISKYPNYKEDIDLILIAEGYSDLIVEL